MKFITILLLLSCVFVVPLSSQVSVPQKPKGEAFLDYLNVYQKYISGIKGSECGMTPSCSNYSIQAFKSYNSAKAFMMTTDRLIRCGHDHKYYSFEDFGSMQKAIDNIVDSNNRIVLRHKRFAFADTSRDRQLKFIRDLMNKSYYSQALLKIQELIFFKSLTDLAAKRELYVNYIRCLSALDKFEEAIYEFEVSFPKEVKESPFVEIEIAICHIQLKNYVRSHQALDDIASKKPDSTLLNRIMMLKGKVYANEYRWEDAKKSFLQIPKESFHKQQADRNIAVLQGAQKIKYKKPILAGMLGIIPGCGYLYAGHKQTALSSFLINTAFGFATYSSIKNKNYGVAVLTGTLSLAFYVGNIQGSVKSAKRYNESKKYDISNGVIINHNY